MATIALTRPDPRDRRRAIPRSPHPSWQYGEARPAGAPRPLTAPDFWARLGL